MYGMAAGEPEPLVDGRYTVIPFVRCSAVAMPMPVPVSVSV